jgi:hypothetical protein
MNMSEALKFASDWSKIAPQGQQSSSQAGTPQTNEQFTASLHASNKRAAEVAQAVRDGIKARQAGRGDGPGATAGAPVERQQELNKTKTKQEIALNDLKLRTEELAPLMAQANLNEKVAFPALAWSLTPGANGKTPSGVTKTQFDLLGPLEKQNHMRIAAGLYTKYVLGNKEK